MNLTDVVGWLENARLPFLPDKAEQTEKGATFKLLNPYNPDNHFELRLIVHEEEGAIFLTVPGVAKTGPGSLVMCAALHSNYDFFFGRFGWDPSDGEIRFVSDVVLVCGPGANDQARDVFMRYVPIIMRCFFGGLNRIYVTELGARVPREVLTTMQDSFRAKLVGWGLIEEEGI
jgi:hypothetical protein